MSNVEYLIDNAFIHILKHGLFYKKYFTENEINKGMVKYEFNNYDVDYILNNIYNMVCHVLIWSNYINTYCKKGKKRGVRI